MQIIQLISVSCLSIIWEKYGCAVYSILTGRRMPKPFSCAPCLSLWITAGIIIYFHDWQNAFLPFTAYILTVLIKRAYDRATI